MHLPLALSFFVAGLVSSIGPCVAPRFLASASLAADRSGRARVTSLFAGIVSGYMVLGTCTSLLAHISRYSAFVYAGLAVALLVSGIHALIARHKCDAAAKPGPKGSLGAAFLMGASSVAIISPCCAPVVAAAALIAGSKANFFASYGMIASFALGHALPVLVAGTSVSMASFTSRVLRTEEALRFVGATLTIALGGYFAVLV